MPKYIVTVREVWYQGIFIEADSPEEATKKVLDGDGESDDTRFDYSHTMRDAVVSVELEETSEERTEPCL